MPACPLAGLRDGILLTPDVLGRAARHRDGVKPHRAHVIPQRPCARVHRDLRVRRFFGSLRREDDVWGVCLVESQASAARILARHRWVLHAQHVCNNL